MGPALTDQMHVSQHQTKSCPVPPPPLFRAWGKPQWTMCLCAALAPPRWLQVLRMGVFELLERKLPPHALSEHVDLVKAAGAPHLAGVANGVLRTASRALQSDTLPVPEVRVRMGAAVVVSRGSGREGACAASSPQAAAHRPPTQNSVA